jgi:hypothetical protein
MGGSLICKDLSEPMLLEVYGKINQILGQDGWMEYVLRLHGYNDEIALEFSLNYRVEHSIISVTHVEVTEETVEEITRLPQTGERWHTRRTS